MRNFLKKNVVAKGSCKKEHSNYHRKYFSESSESKDVSKSHAEYNAGPVAMGGFGGLSPPNKAPSPPNGNMKHYKSWNVCQI